MWTIKIRDKITDGRNHGSLTGKEKETGRRDATSRKGGVEAS